MLFFSLKSEVKREWEGPNYATESNQKLIRLHKYAKSELTTSEWCITSANGDCASEASS